MVNIATIQAVKQKADKVSMPMLMSAMDDVMMGTSYYLIIYTSSNDEFLS